MITGVGTVNALSAGGRARSRRRSPSIGRASGRSGPSPPTDVRSRLAAEVDDGALAALVDPTRARRLSRICRLTVAACRLAVEDAGVGPGPELGLVVGSEHGDFRSSEEFAGGYLRRGPAGLSPMIFPNTVMNTMASVAAIAVGARAPSVTINQATVVGRSRGRAGRGDRGAWRAVAAVAGGVDEICEIVYRHLCRLGVLSPMRGGGPEGCRPYASDHNGPVLGEGATFLVLEAHEAARGARRDRSRRDRRTRPGATCPRRRTPRDRRGAIGALPSAASCLARAAQRFGRCYGSGNGDPGVDDWERALLAKRPRSGGDHEVPLSLAPRFGQHGGLGALRVAAAALDAARGDLAGSGPRDRARRMPHRADRRDRA